MKPVIFTDEEGWRRVRLLRDEDDEENPEIGLPVGPPDITQLPWDEIIRTINNLLVDRGFWNAQQMRAQPELFAKTLSGAIYEYLLAAYREENHS